MALDLAQWCDARIYSVLARPRMYFQGPEALLNVVLELLAFRAKLTGRPIDWVKLETYDRLGLKDGARYVIPERIEDGFVETLTAIALEAGYDPAGWAERDEAWREYDGAARDIEKQKDDLIDKVESRLQQELQEETLFTVRWKLI